jgi:acetyl-CoA carboxylase carboxyltransferase component
MNNENEQILKITVRNDDAIRNIAQYRIAIENLRREEAEYKKVFANPYNAARYGYIDDVIEPRNTRFRIIRALQQLQTKKLTNPAKKHDNLPL